LELLGQENQALKQDFNKTYKYMGEQFGQTQRQDEMIRQNMSALQELFRTIQHGTNEQPGKSLHKSNSRNATTTDKRNRTNQPAVRGIPASDQPFSGSSPTRV
jgi:hypothetical protein